MRLRAHLLVNYPVNHAVYFFLRGNWNGGSVNFINLGLTWAPILLLISRWQFSRTHGGRIVSRGVMLDLPRRAQRLDLIRYNLLVRLVILVNDVVDRLLLADVLHYYFELIHADLLVI